MAGKAGLLIVDVQNDFCPGGALAVPQGDQVVAVLNQYIDHFLTAGLPIYASRDWHPEETSHFSTGGGPWPIHCVQATPGADFHPALRLPEATPVISKGIGRSDDGYSAFEGLLEDGERLVARLRRDGVEHLYVGGLATDYCVRASVLDAVSHGLRVALLVDASRGVEVQPGDVARAEAEMRAAGTYMVTRSAFRLPAALR